MKPSNPKSILLISSFVLLLSIVLNGCLKSKETPLLMKDKAMVELVSKLNKFNCDFEKSNPQYFQNDENSSLNKKKRKSFWQILGIAGCDVMGGILGAGIGAEVGGPAGGLFGFIFGAASFSLWISDLQDGPGGSSNRQALEGSFELYSGQYDTLQTERANSNNNYDCYGNYHNQILDFVYHKADSQIFAYDQGPTAFESYTYIKNYLSTIPTTCQSETIDTSLFSYTMFQQIISAANHSALADTAIAYDSTLIINYFSNSDDLSSYDKEIYVPFLKQSLKITSLSGQLTYTKEYENIIINSLIESDLLIRYKRVFAIQKASLCYWSNAFEE